MSLINMLNEIFPTKLSQNLLIVQDSQTIQTVIDSITDEAADNPYTVMVPPGHEGESYTQTAHITVTSPGRRESTFVVAASNSLHKHTADFICDGTDDQVQIQAAIDAVSAGKIVLLDGDFYISASVIIKGSIWLQGMGQYVTNIHAASGLTGNMFEYNTASISATPEYVFCMYDMHIDGEAENCQLLETENQHATGTRVLKDVKLHNIAALNFAGTNVIHIKPAWAFRAIRVCIEQATGNGLYVEGGSDNTSAMIRQCQIKLNDGHGIVLNGVENSSIVGCELDGGENHFAVSLINSSTTIITSNNFAYGGETAGGHITVDATSCMNIIASNQFDGGNQSTFGVVIAAGAEENTINNNQFLLFTDTEISDAGDNTVKIGNQSGTVPATRISHFPYKVEMANGLSVSTLAEHADNTAAAAAGLAVGSLYRTGDVVKVVH